MINISLSGTGTLLYYYIGVMDAILDKYDTYDGIIGTSGGSIIASLYVIYGKNEAKRIAEKIKLKELQDFSLQPFIGDECGFLHGNKLYELLKLYFDIKFKDISKDLNIVATDLTNGKEVIFNKINTPEVYLYDAIRSSMSIPFVFAIHKIEKTQYIDGFIFNNSPMDFFKDSKKLTIGVKMDWDYKYTDSTDNMIELANRVFSMMILQNQKENETKRDNLKIISIKSDKNSVNFDFSETEIKEMIKKGYEVAKNELR
jgi:NTE family protein